MDAKRAALTHDAIEEQGRLLSDFVVLGEELLELINQQQRARDGLGAAGALVSGDVLHAEFAEQVAAALEFFIDALKHAEAELAVAFDRDDAGVGKAACRVAFELHAFFEVDEVELDLLRAACEREVGDDDVKERRFSRAGLACEECVLARALSDCEILQLCRTGAADGHAEFRGGVALPVVRRLRCDLGERDLDAIRIHARLADFVYELCGQFRVRRDVQREDDARLRLALDGESRLAATDHDRRFAEVVGDESVRIRLALIPMN